MEHVRSSPEVIGGTRAPRPPQPTESVLPPSICPRNLHASSTLVQANARDASHSAGALRDACQFGCSVAYLIWRVELAPPAREKPATRPPQQAPQPAAHERGGTADSTFFFFYSTYRNRLLFSLFKSSRRDSLGSVALAFWIAAAARHTQTSTLVSRLQSLQSNLNYILSYHPKDRNRIVLSDRDACRCK